MRKLVLLEHVSLDGYLAGPNGEMDWIHVDEAMFRDVEPLTADADTAVFGRVTYQMMAAYWPAAGDSPEASAHDINHSRWLNGATKLVVSRSLEDAPWGESGHAQLVRGDVAEKFRALKRQPRKNLLLIGSGSIARTLIGANLIDEYHLNINPVILGGGLPLFPDLEGPRSLRLVARQTYDGGVLGCHYTTVQEQ